jgi:hypothetical protein
VSSSSRERIFITLQLQIVGNCLFSMFSNNHNETITYFEIEN